MFPTVNRGKQIKVASSCGADHQKCICRSGRNVLLQSASQAAAPSGSVCQTHAVLPERRLSGLGGTLKMFPFVGEAIGPLTAWDGDVCRLTSPSSLANVVKSERPGSNACQPGLFPLKESVWRKSFPRNFKFTLERLCRPLRTELIRTFTRLRASY